jgi:hypothetical protein
MQVGLVAAICCRTTDPLGFSNLTSQQCDLAELVRLTSGLEL